MRHHACESMLGLQGYAIVEYSRSSDVYRRLTINRLFKNIGYDNNFLSDYAKVCLIQEVLRLGI